MNLNNPNNFGKQDDIDARGRILKATDNFNFKHKIMISMQTKIKLLKTPRCGDNDQASYNMLVASDGTESRNFPNEDRDYKSVMSAVINATLCRQQKHAGSIKNMALHSSLMTPPDDRSHSRYDLRSFRWDHFDPHYRKLARYCGFERFNIDQLVYE